MTEHERDEVLVQRIREDLKKELPAITATTAVPIKFTVQQWYKILATIIVLLAGVFAAYLRDRADKQELRDQILDQARLSQERDAAAENRWQLRHAELAHTLKTSFTGAISQLKDGTVGDIRTEVSDVKARLTVMENKGILPEARRDIDNLEKQLQQLTERVSRLEN